MKKMIFKVFLIIGALLVCAIVWDFFFNDGGIMSTVWNAVVSPINKMWANVSGTTANLIPEWASATTTGTTGNTW